MRLKDFRLKFYTLCQRVKRKEMEVQYIVTGKNLADILTKSLSGPLHTEGVKALGLVADNLEEVPNDPPQEEPHV